MSRVLSYLRVQLITIFGLNKGLPYLAHGSIIMRECVAYIHDSDTTLTFDPKSKLIGFMIWFSVWTTAFLSCDIVKLCLAGKCITMKRCLVYTYDLCMTLNFDLNITNLWFHHEFKSGKIVFAL